MVKMLIGLAAVVVAAVVGFFGFQFYTQHRISGEIETAFEQIRASGGKASHGKVSFDLLSRTVTIADIAAESATQPPLRIKIASIVAAGVGQPDAARFSADSIETSNIEIDAGFAGLAAGQLAYKIPKVVIKNYSGPASLRQPPASASLIDVYRSSLERLAAISATSVSTPSVIGTMNFGPVPSGDFAYSGIGLRDIKDGKIAAMQIERAVYTVNTQQAGKADKMTGEMTDITAQDFDAAAAATIFDPKHASDDGYHRVYGKATTGAYTITSSQGVRMRIDGMAIEDVAVRPSRLQFSALLPMIPAAGAAPPTPAQARELMEKVATLYEGVRIGTAGMQGMSMDTPQGAFKLAAIKFNLENGKIGEFAFEGLDVRSPTGPVKIGRFALKSLDVAGLLRTTALFSNPAQQPSPDQYLRLFPLIEGIEVAGVLAPYKNTGKPINIDIFSLNWGQFVGPVPSKARLTTRMTTPVDASNPAMLPFIAAGLNTLAVDGDIGAAWTEAARTFVLDAPKLEIGGLLNASVRVALANVPRQAFSFNLPQASASAAQIEAGAVEIMLRDLGGIDLAVAQYARSQNVSRDAARKTIIDSIRSTAATAETNNPDTAAVTEALVRFIETPRTALILKLTPRAKVPAIQLLQTFKTDPLVALSQFRIEASTAL
ncbi:MAG: hypothetical protein ABI561_23535 [Bradyrhizobium sp.]